MEDAVRQELRDLVIHHDKNVFQDPRRCQALLRDSIGSYRREIAVLIAAVEENVPTELLSPTVGTSANILVRRLVQRLQQERGLNRDAAEWAVESWAFALGFEDSARPAHSGIVKERAPKDVNSPSNGEKGKPSLALPDKSRYMIAALIGLAGALIAIGAAFIPLGDVGDFSLVHYTIFIDPPIWVPLLEPVAPPTAAALFCVALLRSPKPRWRMWSPVVLGIGAALLFARLALLVEFLGNDVELALGMYGSLVGALAITVAGGMFARMNAKPGEIEHVLSEDKTQNSDSGPGPSVDDDSEVPRLSRDG